MLERIYHEAAEVCCEIARDSGSATASKLYESARKLKVYAEELEQSNLGKVKPLNGNITSSTIDAWLS